MTYPFLSDEWIEAARRLRAEYELPPPAVPVTMNLVVTDVPFGTGRLLGHLDTTGGGLDIELGHVEHPDVTITTDYATTRLIIVDGDMQAAMAAFLGGRIKVDGDITKMLQFQAPLPADLAERLKALTAHDG